MEVWQIILYGFGAFLAFRVLVALMDRHRRVYLQELAKEYAQAHGRRPPNASIDANLSEDGESEEGKADKAAA